MTTGSIYEKDKDAGSNALEQWTYFASQVDLNKCSGAISELHDALSSGIANAWEGDLSFLRSSSSSIRNASKKFT